MLSTNFQILLTVCLGLWLRQLEAFSVHRLTNAECISYDEKIVKINRCRLRAVKRDVTVFNLNVTFVETINSIQLNAAYLKRANGWKPFVINTTFDVCEYLEKKNNPIGNMLYGQFKDNTNLNHSCPFTGFGLIDNFRVRLDRVRLPMPDGLYCLQMTWFFNKVTAMRTNIYFEFR